MRIVCRHGDFNGVGGDDTLGLQLAVRHRARLIAAESYVSDLFVLYRCCRWEFHALDTACFGNEGSSSKRRQWESICGEWLEGF